MRFLCVILRTLCRPAVGLVRAGLVVVAFSWIATAAVADHVKDLQRRAVDAKHAAWGHWGPDPDKYTSWFQHSNRLIPIYTFGISLDPLREEGSPYRDREALTRLYGRLPTGTLNPEAEYFDQTQVYRLQQAAVEMGKKYIVLVVFDGLDWQTTWAAATFRAGEVRYRSGRGSGLHFQDYGATTTDFGWFVTSPRSNGATCDVDAQRVADQGNEFGGYDVRAAGPAPWSDMDDARYIIGRGAHHRHVYTDSASSATSLTSGVKTYNRSINVDSQGKQVEPIARTLQSQGFAIGVVTSVPVSHATPASAYANNVVRYDYQDLLRDMVGEPSIAHATAALPGVDVLIGAGWGEEFETDRAQGTNFEPGNRFLTDSLRQAIDVAGGGRYRVVLRERGIDGGQALVAAAERARADRTRLFGMFGNYVPPGGSHLPFQTADEGYDPTVGSRGTTESYSQGDLRENPTLAEMTSAALHVLESNERGFWLMIEAGDVDWANHANNIDNSIGAVLSGDEAIRTLTRWVERHDCWDETAIIVTADHGHYLVLKDPVVLTASPSTD